MKLASTTQAGDMAVLRYLLYLGTFGFGGPIALAGYMQRDLVERRKLVTKKDYVDGLALAQLAPGPLAAQLAIYLGWAKGGVAGDTLPGIETWNTAEIPPVSRVAARDGLLRPGGRIGRRDQEGPLAADGRRRQDRARRPRQALGVSR